MLAGSGPPAMSLNRFHDASWPRCVLVFLYIDRSFRSRLQDVGCPPVHGQAQCGFARGAMSELRALGVWYVRLLDACYLSDASAIAIDWQDVLVLHCIRGALQRRTFSRRRSLSLRYLALSARNGRPGQAVVGRRGQCETRGDIGGHRSVRRLGGS